MSNFTPLPDPPCGAISPSGDTCPSDSVAIVASEWLTGYATAIWRCLEHVGVSVEDALRLSPQAVVTVTPLTALDSAENTTADDTGEPSPGSPPGDRPSLRLVP